MKPPSLQDSCLIKLAVSFWSSEDMKKHTKKQSNGFVQMETGLEDIKKSALALPLAPNLKQRLLQIIERVGYELYLFLTKSPVSDLQDGFDLGNDIKWNVFGVINEKLTYNCCCYKRPTENVLNFKCLSMVCDELEIKKIWMALSNSEKDRLRKNNLLTSYWVHLLGEQISDFSIFYGGSILGFDPYRSVDYNMAMHCLNSNLKPAMEYFLNRLTPSERQLLNTEQFGGDNIHLVLLRNILKGPKQEHFKYIASFIEMPLPDLNLYQLIVNEMPSKNLEEFICYLLRQVNLFGDLHYNLFRRVVSMAKKEVKLAMISKLDFFVLNLLAKGRLETFECLLTKKAKSVLHEQLSYRLKQSKGLAPFFTICKNNQSHLLRECFKTLARNTEDENFFSSHLNSILNGSQYDDVY